mmetsp:Transcript_5124/g.17863  ORF Transcript_5124/g.17863 Transcript_5124/m.17863 type:complete len:312 (+) Transcript_5124:1306-2241(+)
MPHPWRCATDTGRRWSTSSIRFTNDGFPSSLASFKYSSKTLSPSHLRNSSRHVADVSMSTVMRIERPRSEISSLMSEMSFGTCCVRVRPVPPCSRSSCSSSVSVLGGPTRAASRTRSRSSSASRFWRSARANHSPTVSPSSPPDPSTRITDFHSRGCSCPASSRNCTGVIDVPFHTTRGLREGACRSSTARLSPTLISTCFSPAAALDESARAGDARRSCSCAAPFSVEFSDFAPSGASTCIAERYNNTGLKMPAAALARATPTQTWASRTTTDPLPLTPRHSLALADEETLFQHDVAADFFIRARRRRTR